MAISEFEIKRLQKYVGEYVRKKRPPQHVRHQLDLGFRIVNQSFEIYEIWPKFQNPEETTETPVAKATYIKSKKIWKLYWKRSDLRWHSYRQFPESKSLEEIIEVIDRDSDGCFWG
jgi:hypothetical protein